MTRIADTQPTADSHLTARQLAGFRAQLTGDRTQAIRTIDRLRAELEDFTSARRDIATDDEHDPEGPTLAFERSQASVLLDQASRHVADIDSALVRIDEGTFGRCARCLEPIALGRLQVRPQASLCIHCAEHIR